MIGPLEYNDAVEVLKDEIAPEAEALLIRVRDVCRERGMRTDDQPIFMDGDIYRWYLRFWRPGTSSDEECIDVAVEIVESQFYGRWPGGVNFGLSIVDWGGLILGGLTPYNFTDQCWVPLGDADAVAERWAILKDADVSDVPDLCIQ